MTKLQRDQILDQVQVAEAIAANPGWTTNNLTRDLCAHVRALAAEVESLEGRLKSLIESNMRYCLLLLEGDVLAAERELLEESQRQKWLAETGG